VQPGARLAASSSAGYLIAATEKNLARFGCSLVPGWPRAALLDISGRLNRILSRRRRRAVINIYFMRRQKKIPAGRLIGILSRRRRRAVINIYLRRQKKIPAGWLIRILSRRRRRAVINIHLRRQKNNSAGGLIRILSRRPTPPPNP